MGTERIVLVPSPLLGPAIWGPVAQILADRGREVTVPPAYGVVRRPEDVVAHLLDAVPDEPLLLVLHSNAGLYAAALAARREVRGLVFVDAGLPADAPATPTAPEAFREHLAGLADADGILPGWTHWWAAEDLVGLFPDESSRARVETEQPRLPLTYFEASVPSPPGWEQLPAAYLAFGDAYAAEVAEAEARGWPVERWAGAGHLHPLAAPEAVAAALEGLVGRMGL